MYTESIICRKTVIYWKADYEKSEDLPMSAGTVFTFHVAQDGSGDFTGIMEALSAIGKLDRKYAARGCGETDNLKYAGAGDFRVASPGEPQVPPVTLCIHGGTYKERVVITRPYLTVEGGLTGKTVLTGSLYARMPGENSGKLGTFGSYSCMIAAHDVAVRDITFLNNAGKGPDVGQALALYADGDRLVFDRCRFLGGQDTLFTAPLPPKEIEPNGFAGPGRDLPRVDGRHYYRDCYFEGDIDFIFGGATAYFEGCEFFSKDIGKEVNSFVTAASTPDGRPYGYVMERCRFTGDCPPHSAYLGRPWREFAQVALLHCQIGGHICPEGWHDWNKPGSHETASFAEYGCTGPSSDLKKRPGWVKKLTPAEAARYQKPLVLGGNDCWDP